MLLEDIKEGGVANIGECSTSWMIVAPSPAGFFQWQGLVSA